MVINSFSILKNEKTVVVFVSKEKKIAVFQFPIRGPIFLRLADTTSLEALAVTLGKSFF